MTEPGIRAIAELPAILFVPGNRPERFDKALRSGAPAIVIDLEDAVPVDAKASARDAARKWLDTIDDRAPAISGVRINSPFTRDGHADIGMLLDAGRKPGFILMPKVESAIEPQLLQRLLGDIALICTIESARGLANAGSIAGGVPSVAALAFGGVDLAADLRAELSWDALLHARGCVVQAAAAASVGVLDVPHLDIAADAALETECRRAKAMGFTGKLAIHPRQIDGIMSAFLPSATEIAEARDLLRAAQQAHGAAAQYKGRMIDEAVLRSARRVMHLATLRREGRS